MDLTDPIAVALAAADALGRAGLEAALYGGLVLAAYGEPRETRDADLAVAGTQAINALEAFRSAGLHPLLAFDGMTFGGLRISRLTLLAGNDDVGLNVVDLVEPRSARYSKTALERSIHGHLRGATIKLLSPEDFVVFKILSSRERDLEDATSVLKSLGPDLDIELVRRECAALAEEIPGFDVLGRARRLLP